MEGLTGDSARDDSTDGWEKPMTVAEYEVNETRFKRMWGGRSIDAGEEVRGGEAELRKSQKREEGSTNGDIDEKKIDSYPLLDPTATPSSSSSTSTTSSRSSVKRLAFLSLDLLSATRSSCSPPNRSDLTISPPANVIKVNSITILAMR